jgi:hypothetical protein
MHAMIIKLLFLGLVICSWKCDIQSVADFAHIQNLVILISNHCVLIKCFQVKKEQEIYGGSHGNSCRFTN